MKKQNGITLISLIITIIIMLILAGVALSMVMGDGSIIEQATSAADNTKAAEVQEYIDLAVASSKMSEYSGIGRVSLDELAEEMKEQGLITEAEMETMKAGEELKINGIVIKYDEIDSRILNIANKISMHKFAGSGALKQIEIVGEPDNEIVMMHKTNNDLTSADIENLKVSGENVYEYTRVNHITTTRYLDFACDYYYIWIKYEDGTTTNALKFSISQLNNAEEATISGTVVE